jgi:hypothetical protein
MRIFSRLASFAAVLITAFSLNVSVSTAASAQVNSLSSPARCPTGFSLNGGQCTRPAVAAGFSCQPGYTLSGQTCSIKISSNTTAQCPVSMGLPGNSSTCQTYNMRTRTWGAPTAQARCTQPGARLQGAQCIVERTQTMAAKRGGAVSCSPGRQVGSQCVATPSCSKQHPWLRGSLCYRDRR